MPLYRRTSGVVFVLLPLLGGCAGNGEGLNNNGRPLDEAGDLPLVAEFDSIQAHVFTPICSVCHAGATAPQGLRLDAANSYNLLVGVPSTEVPSLQRVKAGDPANSYIIRKLEGTAAVGVQMPYGGPYLPAETIAVIRQWIQNGAPRTPPLTAGAADFKLATASPSDGEIVTAPERIVLAFNAELDATRVDEAAVRLERIDPDSADSPPVIVPVAVSVAEGNAYALLIVPRARLPAGSYRVIVAGDYAGRLADLSNRRPSLPPAADNGDQMALQFIVESAVQ